MEAVITGLGSVCSLGRGTLALWDGIAAGRDGIAGIGRFSTAGIKAKLAGMVPDRNDAASGLLSDTRLNVEFATEAGREALAEAGIAPDAADAAGGNAPAPDRIALVLGTSLGEHNVPLYRMTEEVARALGIEGPALTVSTACTSSTNALGLGLDLLRNGTADLVLAGGSDVLTPIMLAGFNALGVLSEGKCAPFSHPFGTTLGEGAGFLVLESRAHAERRGAKVRGVLAGYGLSADAYHETSPEPTGSGVARAIAGALGHAALEPAQIRYVNAHGTGTVANDPAEWRAIRTVFGAGADSLPVSSTKSYLGHAQGAAGVLEAIATLISLENQVVPPTLHFQTARKLGPADPVAAPVPRAHAYRYAVCSNSAFGGANAAVVVARSDTRPSASPASRREVHIGGIGAVGAHGLGLGGLLAAVEAGTLLNRGRVPEFSLGEAVPGVDPRGLDPSSRFVTAAAAQALGDAGLGLRRTRRDRIGLIMGVNRISQACIDALEASVARNGLPLLSANAFSRMVLNAPVGSCSKLLALGGPLSTVSTGEGSGLCALIYAAELLAGRSDADALVAGGLDESGPPTSLRDPGEGASCAVLSNRSFPSAGGPAVVAAGWGMAGRNGLRTAAGTALEAAAASEADIEALFGTGLGEYLPALPRFEPQHALGYGEASASAAALVAAVLWLREGRGSKVMVANGCGESATAALVLSRKG